MTDDEVLIASRGRGSRPVLVLLTLLTIGVVSLVLTKIGGVGLMGFDSYPLILTARIESWADLLGTFTEKLMDGRYSGDYYRPLLNLSFALDYTLWGLDGWGYHLTAALLFGACGIAVASLMMRLLGGRIGLGVLAATLFFFLHDSHFEVLPVPARRPELLCGVLACFSLASQLGRKALAQPWPLIPGLLMFLAAASKETGYALPAISVVAVFLYSPAGSVRQRAKQALRAGTVHAAFIFLLLCVRTGVLGGMGGPAPLPETFVGPSSLELSLVLFERLFIPQNVAPWGAIVPLLAGLTLLGVASLCKTTSRGRSALLVSLAWMTVVGLLYGISRSIEQWYLFLPVIGLALAVGAAVDLLASTCCAGQKSKTLLAGATALVLAGFTFCQVRYSPLFHAYPEWQRASAASEEFFEKLDRRIARKQPGEVINAPPIPMWYPPPTAGPGIRGGAILEKYSVQAWLELKYPDRKFRVLNSPALSPLGGDESAVQLLRPYLFDGATFAQPQ